MMLVGRLLSYLLASHVAMWAATLNLGFSVILNIVFITQMGVARIALSPFAAC
jgi:hypothetical protein